MLDEVIIFSEALSDDDLKVLIGGIKGALSIVPKDKVATIWGQIKK